MESIDPNQLNLNALSGNLPPVKKNRQKTSSYQSLLKSRNQFPLTDEINQDLASVQNHENQSDTHALTDKEKAEISVIKDMLHILPGRLKQSILNLENIISKSAPERMGEIENLKNILVNEFHLPWHQITPLTEQEIQTIVKAFENLESQNLSPVIQRVLQNKI